MAGEDPHSPTQAGPYPAGEPIEAAVQSPDAPVTEPFVPPPADTGFGQPAGSGLLGGGEPVDPHPEKLVGAAFAGGLVAALVLKGMARRKHA